MRIRRQRIHSPVFFFCSFDKSSDMDRSVYVNNRTCRISFRTEINGSDLLIKDRHRREFGFSFPDEQDLLFDPPGEKVKSPEMNDRGSALFL
jgi:hypothetical protein